MTKTLGRTHHRASKQRGAGFPEFLARSRAARRVTSLAPWRRSLPRLARSRGATRLAAAGRVAPRSAEAPRTVLLEPAATNFGAPTTLAPPIAVAAIAAPDAERGDAGLELARKTGGLSAKCVTPQTSTTG